MLVLGYVALGNQSQLNQCQKSASTTNSALSVRSPNRSADNTKQKSASKPAEAGNVSAQGDATECKFCGDTFPEEDGKLIQCGRCDSGVCVSCSMLDTAMYDLMTARSRGIHWFCKDCDAQAMKDVQTGQQIEERCMHYFEKCRAEIHEVEVALSTRIDTEVARLDSEVGVLKKSSASQKSKNAELSENLDKVMGKMEEYEVAVEQKINEKTSNIAQMSISEVLEREKRKDQLILFNIKESDKAEAKDRKAEDTNEVNRILESINAPSEYAMINRVGPKGATPRPVKIKLTNQDDQTKILKAAKNLKGTEIYINKDMTPLEQAEHGD